jgi:hypothetical protein
MSRWGVIWVWPLLVADKPARIQASSINPATSNHNQVQELLGVLREGGPAALEAHAPAPLDWHRVRQLAGPGAVGLPIGYQPPPLQIQQRRQLEGPKAWAGGAPLAALE